MYNFKITNITEKNFFIDKEIIDIESSDVLTDVLSIGLMKFNPDTDEEESIGEVIISTLNPCLADRLGVDYIESWDSISQYHFEAAQLFSELQDTPAFNKAYNSLDPDDAYLDYIFAVVDSINVSEESFNEGEKRKIFECFFANINNIISMATQKNLLIFAVYEYDLADIALTESELIKLNYSKREEIYFKIHAAWDSKKTRHYYTL